MKKSLVALAFGGFGIGITEFVIMGLLESIAQDLRITIPEAGHLITAYALGVVIGAPILVLIAGKYPPKKLLMGLMMMFIVFNGLSAFAPTYQTLIIARLLSGLPHGAFFGIGAVVASRLASPGKQAQAVAVMFSGLTVANLFGVPLSTWIGQNFNWRWAFGVVVLAGMVTFVSLYFWMPDMRDNNREEPSHQLSFFAKRESWLMIATIAIGFGGFFAWFSYVSPMMTQIAGFSENAMTYIMMLAGLGMMLGNLLGGRIADRFSPAQATVWLLLLMAATLLTGHFMAPFKIPSLVMIFVTGVVCFTMGAPIQMLMINTAKGAEMLGASVSQASFNMGNSLGAFFGGLPIAAGLGFTSQLWVGATMALTGSMIAALLIWSMRRQAGPVLTDAEKLRTKDYDSRR